MVNPFKETNWNPDIPERRKFALSLMIGCPALAAAFSLIRMFSHHAWNPSLFWLALGGLAIGAPLWLLPRIATPFYRLWYFAACCIGIVVSNLLLILFFYGAITPIGLILKALGRDPMTRRREPKRESYWKPAEKAIDPERYFRQY